MKRGSVVNRLLDRYVGIPVLFALSIMSRRRRLPKTISRIGVSSSHTLGDTLINSAVVQDLRSHFPDAHLIFFAAPTNIGVARLLPGPDEIVEISMTRPLSTINILRRSELDLLVDFTPWQRLTSFFALASGAKYTVGFESSGQYRHWHYDQTVKHLSTVHELENFRRLVRVLGVNATAEPKLNVSSYNPLSRASSIKTIVFHPWATGDLAIRREWPTEYWIRLGTMLADDSTEFYITGAPAQIHRSEDLCRKLRDAGLRAQPFRSSSGLAALSAWLAKADLIVSVNTGIMHLAAILGCPTVALNGPTSTLRWGPVGPRTASVTPRGGGCGFLHLGFEFAGNPTDCMERTQVEDVFHEIQKLVPELLVSAKATAR
jgi:heptosyltransferase I